MRGGRGEGEGAVVGRARVWEGGARGDRYGGAEHGGSVREAADEDEATEA